MAIMIYITLNATKYKLFDVVKLQSVGYISNGQLMAYMQ